MRVPIKLPDTGEPARFSTWFVRLGESVREGERMAEVLIPGVAIDVLAPCDGVLADTTILERQSLAPGDTIGSIETDEPTLKG